MELSNYIAENAGWNSWKDNYIVEIKHCLQCGHTQRLPERNTTCPSCDHTGMFFFRDEHHLVKYIDRYGLGNVIIIDEDIRQIVLNAFL